MAKRIVGTTPKADGFRMPAEFEAQEQVWMIWPERPDNWRDGAKPAQKSFANVAKAISRFTKMNVLVSQAQYANCREQLPDDIRVIEMSNNDAWMRDCGPTFIINDKGEIRANDWDFNAWGGLVDGLYFPWDQDELIARKVTEIEGIDTYKTKGFVLEGGSFHVDGQGTVMTTEMCLLSEGRNPHMSKTEIEQMLCDHLNCEKVLWIKDGIDPDETNGHVDDVACFVAPGEVACIYTDDTNSPFYAEAQAAYKTLTELTDAKGRALKVHKLCCPKNAITIKGYFAIDTVEGTLPREDGDICITSYMNFLITNGGVIVPQYGDENDALALTQVQEMFPDKEIVGVDTLEIVYGGGNIHCVTQQQPKK
ncbi:MAG: agmatine deiminase [Lactococcus raffinolactis]|nr:agmatine deiminase [Lactococcus raffinolactis]MDN5414896.1 agmatine deiminase [Lactococcus raffinolactis]MDN5472861.1 agmatine deiminase [Lactococcus raffinolactis]MDN5494042.1 agmatine deiminase [Lactococcus raffinolactis]MDN5579644.1 agmatine deiminase [Lactococcus raffinolactis]